MYFIFLFWNRWISFKTFRWTPATTRPTWEKSSRWSLCPQKMALNGAAHSTHASGEALKFASCSTLFRWSLATTRPTGRISYREFSCPPKMVPNGVARVPYELVQCSLASFCFLIWLVVYFCVFLAFFFLSQCCLFFSKIKNHNYSDFFM